MHSAILKELHGIDGIANRLGPSVSMFGSARLQRDTATYRLARQMAHDLAGLGYPVISGGGPGIMRAANEGAREGGGIAVGFNISLLFEPLDVTQQDISLTFDNFFTRKLAYARCSHAFVALPGGMGTLDELFDVLTLMQTHKLKPCPVVLVGSDFWRGLVCWMREQMVDAGYISEDEIDAIDVFDTANEVTAFLAARLPRPQPMPLGTKRFQLA